MQSSILRLNEAEAGMNCGLDLPKNVNEYTFLLIWDYVKRQQKAVSAEQVALGVGVSRSTARRYLEYCFEQGMLKRTMSYLNVGRPRHRFLVNQ